MFFSEILDLVQGFCWYAAEVFTDKNIYEADYARNNIFVQHSSMYVFSYDHAVF